MKFEDLTPEDQKLLQTDLGEDIEKAASDQVKVINECYEHGFNDMATSVADEFDKFAQEEEKAKEEKAKEEKKEEKGEEEEEEKEMKTASAEYGSFTERGFFDGLCKLGQERHGEPSYYLWPFIEEKIAAVAGKAALSSLWSKAIGKGKAGLETAKKYQKGTVADVKAGVTGKRPKPGVQKVTRPSRLAAGLGYSARKGLKRPKMKKEPAFVGLTAGQRAKALAKGLAPYAGGAALVGGGAYGAKKAMD